MDDSNTEAVLPDGTPYLRVDAMAVGGDIRFSVSILDPLLDIANSTGFGLQSFGFNLGIDAQPITAGNIGFADPDVAANWSISVTDGSQEDGYGLFNVVLNTAGDGNRVTPTLEFFIFGVTGDTPMNYVSNYQGPLSNNNAGEGEGPFVARVAGFTIDGSSVSSSFFGGGTVVPLPASVWMLIGGLGVLWRARRRRAA